MAAGGCTGGAELAIFRKGSTRPKKEKTFCRTCGAKNEAGVTRCRVCTSFMPQDLGGGGIEMPDLGLTAPVEAPVETLAAGSPGATPISGLAELDHFDPDALQIGEAALPRPSTNEV